ncbi:NADPH-dependent assimilatory sulfite reductase hemoprotein subunit [Modicisalibacter tunisiensis]|uniref:Sulfite reductase [NADPH] hemoprotein beta-component n=1 Tax=Modicisalibacter tunisiensis TaxID=390637 RepID=A0ABS7WWR4_9GAMM|nr:NADPH-dependent assimilatory sulfite reductase hemoprotein subunit [Modicisalibacter tunisiensis]MBZ9567048.1 NADPH-dependent assimilatory sulfite reductase hemoprotein subunit [Modicisalibacter tunisiensis]
MADSRTRDITAPLEDKHPNERLKMGSRYLRGTIEASLADPITGALAADDTQLTKFHGFYQQDDRDLRDERRHQKLEPAYQMMIRLRLPGGTCTPAQWLALDDLARRYGDGGLRLTTRQTFQYHGVLKRDIKAALQGIDAALLDTLAACGDVNRTVMAAVNPHQSRVHAAVQRCAREVSDHLAPRTHAYREIWLDGERVDPDADEEPLYGPTYLPRKFKIGFAVPPVNDIDVYSQDIGLIAAVEEGELAGFTVCVGGGLGRTENEPATFPRLADPIGFCRPEQVNALAETIVAIQRDHGDRVDRKHARMKYTIDDRGVDWFREELERRLGWSLEPAREVQFAHNGDRYGWVEGDDGRWHYTLFIENGRIRDWEDYPLMSGLRAIAEVHDGEFQLTPNQNLTLAAIAPDARDAIQRLITDYGLERAERMGRLRRNAMACVALPTCGLAMAESERYLPSLIDALERRAADAGIGDTPIVVRMTGCPNGCARPYLAEIGFTGRGPGKYNLYLGGGFHGQRLNKLYRANIGEAEILEILDGLFRHYAAERQAGEAFGDFTIRAGYVAAVTAGRHFHD